MVDRKGPVGGQGLAVERRTSGGTRFCGREDQWGTRSCGREKDQWGRHGLCFADKDQWGDKVL